MLSGQVLFQVLGFGASILIIRNTSPQDYGLYTLILSIQMLIAAISASGIMAGYQKIGAQVWKDEGSLGDLYHTATVIRRNIFLLAIVVSSVYGAFTFTKAGYSLSNTAIYILVAVALAYPSVHLAFLQYILLLKQRIVQHQQVTVLDRLVKVLMVAVLLFVVGIKLNIALLLICTIVPAYLSLFSARHSLADIRGASKTVNPEYHQTMMEYIRKNWHNSVFYAFKGQISILILATLASMEEVAGLGALSRFGVVLAMLATVFTSTFGIEFAKEENKHRAKRSYIIYLTIATVVAVVSVTAASFITPLLLSILGPEYAGLGFELIMVLIGGFVSVLVTMSHAMNISKGWIHYSPFLEIPLTVIGLVVSIIVFDLSTLGGAIKLGILSSLTLLLLTLLNAYHGFKHWQE